MKPIYQDRVDELDASCVDLISDDDAALKHTYFVADRALTGYEIASLKLILNRHKKPRREHTKTLAHIINPARESGHPFSPEWLNTLLAVAFTEFDLGGVKLLLWEGENRTFFWDEEDVFCFYTMIAPESDEFRLLKERNTSGAFDEYLQIRSALLGGDDAYDDRLLTRVIEKDYLKCYTQICHESVNDLKLANKSGATKIRNYIIEQAVPSPSPKQDEDTDDLEPSTKRFRPIKEEECVVPKTTTFVKALMDSAPVATSCSIM